jgi:hypothetical protein
MLVAPRTDLRLVAALARLDDRKRPIADTNRQLGAVVAHLGLPQPSYEQVRRLVHELRAGRSDARVTVGEVLLDIAFRARPPIALVELLAGTLPPKGSK